MEFEMTESMEIARLREKVNHLDSELYKLRSQARKAIGEYDDLYLRYNKAEKTNEELKKKFNEQEMKFNQVVEMLQTAANDYAVMESKVTLGEYLKTETEKFASKIYKENRKIKRQSQKLMTALGNSTVMIDIDIDGEPDDSSINPAQIESLTNMITQLEKNIEVLQSKCNNAVIERQKAITEAEEYRLKYADETQKLLEAKSTISMYETMKENFARVSQIAADRIETLEKNLELGKSLTEQAILKASDYHKKHKAIQRQSMAFLHSPNNDESLNKALEQIEKLTMELEQQKIDFERKITTSSSESQNGKIDDLQKEIDTLLDENENVAKQNKDLLHQLETVNHNNRVLREQRDQARRGPPPPPPPPPPPIKIVNPIKWMIGKKSKRGDSSKGPKKPQGDENFDKALKELMERIKTRSSDEPSAAMQQLLDGDVHQTSKQLNDFIGGLKKTVHKHHSEEARKPEPEPEFLQIRRKMSLPVIASKDTADRDVHKDNIDILGEEDEVVLRR